MSNHPSIYTIANAVHSSLLAKELEFDSIMVINYGEKGMALRIDTRVEGNGQVWVFHSLPVNPFTASVEAEKIAKRVAAYKRQERSNPLPNEELLEPAPPKPEIDFISNCATAYQIARNVHLQLSHDPFIQSVQVSVSGLEYPLKLRVEVEKVGKQVPLSISFQIDCEHAGQKYTEDRIIQVIKGDWGNE